MKLIVDNREQIKEEFGDIDVELANLIIGDYQFNIEDKPFIIIERKTIDDYAASIKDGRLREQKKRLLNNCGEAFVLYLVEGDLTKNNGSYPYNRVEKDTIISSIVNTMVRDGVHVFHTKDKDETIFFLSSLYKKLKKQGNSFINKKTDYRQDLVANLNCNISKSKNITPNLCFKMMLNTIPKVSNKISERVANRFETLHNFISQMDKIESEEQKLNTIISIKMSDDAKGRRISKTSAQNIITYMGF